ncbi:MAG: YihY/virulence factor BrkB family protein [Pseudomonadota bacterium]|nr:YihY/virulence factor BrkB family protein [Pseudomonadota bacterium]
MANGNRGFQARSPMEIPIRGWWDISKRVYHNLSQDNLSFVAAGVAFYALLAIFPALAAIVSVYAYFASPTDIHDQLDKVIAILPASSRDIILLQVSDITQQSNKVLSASAIGTLLLTIWSSSKGCQALITACNITYHQRNKRQFFMALVVRFLFSLGAIVVALVALLIIGVLPIVLNLVGLTELIDLMIQLITWPLLAIIFNLALAFLYRYAPHRTPAKWRWITPGSMLATLMWIIASIGFSYYVSQFASYNETYGSLGGVVIMLMWLYISAYIIIFGAAINASTEQQTLVDSTIGPEKAVGKRGAIVADRLTIKQRENEQ